MTPDHFSSPRSEEAIPGEKPNYTTSQARVEAQRCLSCYDAPCIQACPTAIDIPQFMRHIAQGNNRGAAKTILDANILGYTCARVCPVEVLCVGACVYTPWGQPPIPIGRLQHYAVEAVWDTAGSLLEKQAPTGKRVAVVGAGPAGLAASARLALGGCSVDLLEAKPWGGGLNTAGIAPHKLHAVDALREVEFLLGLGVTFKPNTRVGVDISAGALLESYDAVFLGLGLGPDRKLHIPGEDLPGVVGATAWIEHMKTGTVDLDTVHEALVIGGGNTALDVAQELKSLGVDRVWLVYRRDEAAMSGYQHEWARAQRLGVKAVWNAVPQKITEEGGKLVLHVGKKKDSATRWRVDLIVTAVGQSSLEHLARQFPGVEVDQGRMATDAQGRTGNPQVFAGGDCANGGMEVVDAVAMGQRSAAAMLTSWE